MNEEEARSAALHLAGHAVIAEACGAPYGPLALEAELDGTCSFATPALARPGGPARTPTEAAVIVALAGSEAEAAFGVRSERACTNVARLLTDGDPAEVEPYLEWLRLKAARAIEHPLRQRLIRAIADALAERRALTASEVGALARGVISRYMRGQGPP